MKISKIFNLNKSQFELDFIDIDIDLDTPLFIDPYVLATRRDQWSESASRTVQDFFGHLLFVLNAGDHIGASRLFENLGEPNETCLGLGKSKPQGRGVGKEDTLNILTSLTNSAAVKSGLLENLEDCHLFIDGFAKDKLSDMTTNIIRKHLYEYTKDQCGLYGIPLVQCVQTGPYWEAATSSWESSTDSMLVIDNRRILLVPKSIVTYNTQYTPDQPGVLLPLTLLINHSQAA